MTESTDTTIEATESSPTDFSTFGLSELRLAAVEALGWTTPTPIQSKAIPAIAGGRDVVGIARTGTGKTGAFMLPRSSGSKRAPASRS